MPLLIFVAGCHRHQGDLALRLAFTNARNHYFKIRLCYLDRPLESFDAVIYGKFCKYIVRLLFDYPLLKVLDAPLRPLP